MTIMKEIRDKSMRCSYIPGHKQGERGRLKRKNEDWFSEQ